MIVAEMSGAARRHAQRRDLTEAGTDVAVADLQEIAAGRADLLAEVAGVMLGTSAYQLDEPRSKAAAQLSRQAPMRSSSRRGSRRDGAGRSSGAGGHYGAARNE